MPRCSVFIVLLLWGFPSCPVDAADVENDRLVYDVMYKGLNVARAEMWSEIDDALITLNWIVETKSIVQFLFHVNNFYQVMLDSSGRMLQVKKSVDQKNIRQEWVINYDWTAERAVSNQDFAWPVTHGCFHLLSMLFHLRAQPPAVGDSLEYVLDIESQIWRLKGVVTCFNEGNLTGNEIVFSFSPALDIIDRAWKTDMVTNRMGSFDAKLVIRLAPPPIHKPMLVQFGNENTLIEMRLTP